MVGDGFAFELTVVVFDVGLVFVDDVDVVLLPLVFETVVVVDDVFETVVELAFAFVFARLALALLAGVSPPQAAPKLAKPKSAESAIAFFM